MDRDTLLEWLNIRNESQQAGQVGRIFSFASDVGLRRSENQDRVAIVHVSSAGLAKSFWCAALVDGMGGHSHGGKAATIGLSTFIECLIRDRKLYPIERLQRATKMASEAVRLATQGGGCTMSALLIEADRVFSLNVGDSRIYRFGLTDLKIERLTKDDTMQELYDSDGVGLLQYIGMRSDVFPHIEEVTPHRGLAIITSDGAHVIGDALLAEIAAHASSTHELCGRVTQIARWTGGRDNSSIIAFDIEEVIADLSGPPSTDVSVWSLQGRLKFAWSMVEARSENRDLEETQSRNPVKQPQRSTSSKAGSTINHSTKGREKPTSEKRTAERRKKRPTKKSTTSDQISLALNSDTGE